MFKETIEQIKVHLNHQFNHKDNNKTEKTFEY